MKNSKTHVQRQQPVNAACKILKSLRRAASPLFCLCSPGRCTPSCGLSPGASTVSGGIALHLPPPTVGHPLKWSSSASLVHQHTSARLPQGGGASPLLLLLQSTLTPESAQVTTSLAAPYLDDRNQRHGCHCTPHTGNGISESFVWIRTRTLSQLERGETLHTETNTQSKFKDSNSSQIHV